MQDVLSPILRQTTSFDIACRCLSWKTLTGFVLCQTRQDRGWKT